MKCPLVGGPRDVPALREWMLYEWFPPNAFAQSAAIQIVGHQGTEGEIATAVRWNLEGLVLADLWWIDAAMSDLVAQSSTDLPPVTLRPELVPSAPVLAVFERPLYGSDAQGDPREVRVDALMWGWSDLRDAGPALGLTMYQRVSLDAGLSQKAIERGSALVVEVAGHEMHRARPTKHGMAVELHGELWIPVGRTHWQMSTDWSHRIVDRGIAVDDAAHESMCEDRRWLATLWALAREPKIAEQREDRGHRGDRRRAERAGKPPPTVKVVSLRRAVHANAGAEPSGEGRTYHVRWPVKGHWRQQPYGPGRAFRRPQFIAPYVKGPDDAPLRKGATVRVLSDDE